MKTKNLILLNLFCILGIFLAGGCDLDGTKKTNDDMTLLTMLASSGNQGSACGIPSSTINFFIRHILFSAGVGDEPWTYKACRPNSALSIDYSNKLGGIDLSEDQIEKDYIYDSHENIVRIVETGKKFIPATTPENYYTGCPAGGANGQWVDVVQTTDFTNTPEGLLQSKLISSTCGGGTNHSIGTMYRWDYTFNSNNDITRIDLYYNLECTYTVTNGVIIAINNVPSTTLPGNPIISTTFDRTPTQIVISEKWYKLNQIFEEKINDTTNKVTTNISTEEGFVNSWTIGMHESELDYVSGSRSCKKVEVAEAPWQAGNVIGVCNVCYSYDLVHTINDWVFHGSSISQETANSFSATTSWDLGIDTKGRFVWGVEERIANVTGCVPKLNSFTTSYDDKGRVLNMGIFSAFYYNETGLSQTMQVKNNKTILTCYSTK